MSSGRLIIPLAEPALNAQGLVAPGTTMTVYDTGTTNLSAMYQNAALSTPALNPQTANSAGRFEAQCTVFWLDAAAAYDVLLNFPDGSSVQFDEIYVLGAGADTSGFAPINSPNFTGIPTAPTPGGSDNSTKIVTTAWVQSQAYAPQTAGSTSTAGLLQLATNAETLTGTDTAKAITADDLHYVAVNVAAPGSFVKAFASWDNTGALQHGYNVASVTKVTTGTFTITFTNAMPDANYAVALGVGRFSVGFASNSWSWGISAKSAGSITVQMGSSTVATLNDPDNATITIFR